MECRTSAAQAKTWNFFATESAPGDSHTTRQLVRQALPVDKKECDGHQQR